MNLKRIISIVLTVACASTLLVGCGSDNKVIENKYVKLGQYKGFNYNIDQEKFDEMLADKTYEATEVSRAAKMGDEIEFSYVGYVDNKKEKDLTQKNISAETKQDDNAVYKKMTDALIGKKKGDTAKVKLSAEEASSISNSGKKYSKDVNVDLKVKEISEVNHPKVTDDWVKNESNEDVETAKEFFGVIDDELEQNAVADVWQKAVDNAKLKTWPPELYDRIEEEEIGDAKYNAAEWDMTLEEYYAMNGDTQESLEKEYMNQVKSILVMQLIVKEEGIKVTNKEIEDRYNELFKEVKDGKEYKTLADVKKNYPRDEIEEAVSLEKAQAFVYENSKVKKTYKVHNN